MYRTRDNIDESDLLKQLSSGDKEAFNIIYLRYWDRLFAFAFNRLHDQAYSEEVVQEVFISLWENRSKASIRSSITAYLFGAAKYKILNIIRYKKVREDYARDFLTFLKNKTVCHPELDQNVKDLKKIIEESLTSLPPKCQQVYRMSREQFIPNQVIADQLQISKKTVENYLTRAIKHLTIRLTDIEYNIKD